MADARQRKTLGIRFRFLVRALGLLGLAAAAAGAVLFASAFPNPDAWTVDTLRSATQGEAGGYAKNAAIILHVGLISIILMLVVELLGGLFQAASRRTAAGTAATVATIAAIALLGFVNAISFKHYTRRDLTRDQQFTLPAGVADELKKLRSDDPTTIVVLQKHRTFGLSSDLRDSYASESEAKVAEKVKDLVDQFREFGPRFNVVVLDTEEFGYESKVAALTENPDPSKSAPELKAAIDAAPENSILFHANKRVQRLGFNEFLQLDRTASKEANDGRGNLVLLPQGVESFARRILAVQERRPKVAICVIHGFLGTEGLDDFTHAGLRKTLTDHGFDVTDIVLKKWGGGPPSAAAYTRQESKIEEIEGERELASLKVLVIREEVSDLGKIKESLGKLGTRPVGDRVRFYNSLFEASKNRSWLEVISVYKKWEDKLSEKTEPEFKKELIEKLDAQKAVTEKQIAEFEKERQAIEDKLTAAYRDERSIQDRRITDVKAKFARLLADVDLLVLPRYTISNVTTGREIPPDLHALDKDQVEAIREFMKSGRPVLALMGSISEAQGPNEEAADGVEKLIADRGVILGKETVVYDSEMKMLAAQGVASQFGAGGGAETDPLRFEDKVEGENVVDRKPEDAKKPNPVGDAMRLSGRSLEQKFDLKLRALRPVYISEAWQNKLSYAAEFLLTGADTWNESQPFARGDRSGRATYVPKFEPTKDDDAKKGTKAEEKRGPFPVAVAIESRLPTAWFDEEAGRQQTAAAVLPAAVLTKENKTAIPNGRLVVFGHGGVFVGTELKPSQEKLLLHSANWLLNRSDRLPAAPEKAWSYPRVQLSEQEIVLWRWGTGLLLPLGVVVFGLFAVMMRKTR